MTEEEQTARDAIERMVADWDEAYAQRNAHGMVGHGLPDEPRREQVYRAWAVVTDWTEDTTAQSTVHSFRWDGEQVVTVVEQRRSFCFRRPLPEYALPGRLVLGLLARFTFLEREVNRFIWVKTWEGWLCQSEQRLSYRLRLQRRGAPSRTAAA